MQTRYDAPHTPTDSRWLRWSLTIIAALLAVIAVELSALLGPVMPRAQAQLPDSGLQRQQLLEAQARTNQLLEQIVDQLRSGTVKVTLSGTDKETSSGAAPAPRPAKAAPKLPATPRAR